MGTKSQPADHGVPGMDALRVRKAFAQRRDSEGEGDVQTGRKNEKADFSQETLLLWVPPGQLMAASIKHIPR